MATVIVLVHLNGKPLEDWTIKGREGGGSSPPPLMAGMVAGGIEAWERKDALPPPSLERGYSQCIFSIEIFWRRSWYHFVKRVPHCNENPIYEFLFWELHGLSPNFHIHVSVSDLYIFAGSVHIFPAAE